MFKDPAEMFIDELMLMPTQDYWVTITYTTKNKPKEYLYFSYPQFDSDPYFPRVNRFYEFCVKKMKDFSFVDYEIKEYKREIPRYQENLDKEFIIH